MKGSFKLEGVKPKQIKKKREGRQEVRKQVKGGSEKEIKKKNY